MNHKVPTSDSFALLPPLAGTEPLDADVTGSTHWVMRRAPLAEAPSVEGLLADDATVDIDIDLEAELDAAPANVLEAEPATYRRAPPPPDSDPDATLVYDRPSVPRAETQSPSRASLSFPAAQFSSPRTPQPFVPPATATKRLLRPAPPAAPLTETRTRNAPLEAPLPPTSRRELSAPTAYDSIAPLSIGSLMIHPSSAPARRGSFFPVAVALLVAVASAGVIGVAAFRPEVLAEGRTTAIAVWNARAGHAAASVAPAAAPAAEGAAAAPSAVPPVAEEEDVFELADDQSWVSFADSAKDHRVFVDGVAIGDAHPMAMKCGKRKIQIGSAGTPRTADLPCGGGITLE